MGNRRRGSRTQIQAAPFASARWTSLSGAIDYSATLFAGNGFEGVRQVIDISGDGVNNRGRPPVLARDQAVAAGITINGLPILNDRPNPWGGAAPIDLDRYYEENVIGGPGAFYIAARDFDDFAAAILSKLIREIAGRRILAGIKLFSEKANKFLKTASYTFVWIWSWTLHPRGFDERTALHRFYRTRVDQRGYRPPPQAQ